MIKIYQVNCFNFLIRIRYKWLSICSKSKVLLFMVYNYRQTLFDILVSFCVCSVASVSLLLAIEVTVFWNNTPREITSLISYSEVKNQVSLYVSFEITVYAWQKKNLSFFSHLLLKWILLHRSEMSECSFLFDCSNLSYDHLQESS